MKCPRIIIVSTFALALWIMSAAGKTDSQQRPEATLLDFLTRPLVPTVAASDECIRDSQTYFTELRKYSPWALQMYDASTKIPTGVITGNIQQLGNYDECLQIKTDQGFAAQACSASVQFEILKGPKTSNDLDMKDLLLQIAKASNLKDVPTNSVNYEWMWCLPSTCNHSEISEALELALDPLKVDGRIDFAVKVNANSCHTILTDNTTFDAADWSYTIILLAFSVLIISSTAYNLHEKSRSKESKRKDTIYSILTLFSLYINGKRLLSTERSANTITCLDGLRFISICWIIYGHTFYVESVGVKMDRIRITKLHENWSSMFVLNGNIVTDTFFLLSGILLAYTSLVKRSKEANSSLNVVNLYLNRYFRLTPAYAIIIGFYCTLFNKLGSGPKWDTWINSSKSDCRDNWWTNLLYINNYVNIANICMAQSWYLSVDMQLLWISPIFLYPMLRFNRGLFFWTITGIGIFVSILLPFCITYFHHLTGTMLYYKNTEDVTNVYLQIYTKVYTRAGPYIIGLALGYILFKTRSYRIRMTRTYVLSGWLIATVAGMAAVLGPRGMYFNDHHYNQLESSFYAGLHRHVFTLAICWIIFACINGYGGPINTFLSWKAWVPLSKLTYSAYLSHYMILLANIGSARTSGSLTIFNTLHAFFGNLCLTMLISLCLSCCFEMPFMMLARHLLTPKKLKGGGILQTKPSTELIFDSAESGQGMYRSCENIATSKSSSTDSVFIIGGEPARAYREPTTSTNVNSNISRKSMETLINRDNHGYVGIGEML